MRNKIIRMSKGFPGVTLRGRASFKRDICMMPGYRPMKYVVNQADKTYMRGDRIIHNAFSGTLGTWYINVSVILLSKSVMFYADT